MSNLKNHSSKERVVFIFEALNADIIFTLKSWDTGIYINQLGFFELCVIIIVAPCKYPDNSVWECHFFIHTSVSEKSEWQLLN